MKNILSIAALATIIGAGAAQAGPNLVQDGSFATTTSGTFYNGVGDNQFWSDIGYHGDSLHGVTSNPLPAPPLFNNGNSLSFAGGPTPPYNFVYSDAGSGFQSWANTQTINGLQAGKTYNLSFYSNYFTENNNYGDTGQWIANLGGSLDNTGNTYHGFTGGETRVTPFVTIPSNPVPFGPNGTGWIAQSLSFTANDVSEAPLTFISNGSGFPATSRRDHRHLSLTAGGGVPVKRTEAWAMMLAGVFGLGLIVRAVGAPVRLWRPPAESHFGHGHGG